MKITVDIDCTPEEARSFLGLPDVSALQKDMIEMLKERMGAGIKDMDAEALMKLWMPVGGEGWPDMMKSFWGKAGGGKT